MAFVVTQACIGCRYGECAVVCPQDAFREGPNFMVIDPGECINCGICEMVCPVNAIVAERELPPDQQEYRELNARLAKLWPVASEPNPLPDAEVMAFQPDKRNQLVLDAISP